MTMKSHYETLGVPKDGDITSIKRAYRKLALELHPDRGGDEEEFKKVSEAYEVLSDPDKKRKYDNPLHSLFSNQNASEFGGFGSFGGLNTPMDPTSSANFFANLFGGEPVPERPCKKTPSKNSNHKVLLTLEDFYMGKTCKFAISRKVQCKECKGEGGWGKKYTNCIGCNGQGIRVSQRSFNSMSKSTCMQCHGSKSKMVFDKICMVCKTIGVVPERVVAEAKFEAGARPGDQVVLKGMSDYVQGRPAGDVVVTASEKSHRIFKRKNTDLKCSININIRQSLLGFSTEVTHLDGRKVEVKSDGQNVTPHGHKIVVKGEGIPRGKGCLEITTNVVFPKSVPDSITARLAECLEVIEKQ